ncbi:MAG TPA: ParB/RepB/Spo0J family partition protein [Burkholderiaceae bacterium]
MSKTATPTNRSSNSLEADVPSAPPETHRRAGIALRAGEQEAVLAYLPLRGLRIDERNVRKDSPTEAEIEELADLIAAQGLLQNLTVLAYDSARRGKGKDKHRIYTHGVIAGGRRLRALHLLVKRGRITLDEQVLCAVVPADRAIAVSMAENQGQKPMSIADTVQAFADMVTAGAGIDDIALCFGLTPLTVKRRLKLATVSPKLFALFRAGRMAMDQLIALSLADTHEKQESVWECLPVFNRSPAALRQVILGEGVRGHLVRFVGIQAYEAAGGHVVRDLFADEEGSAAHIGDPELMQRMALDKLKTQAAELCEKDGWPWVDVAFDYDHTVRQRYQKAPTSRREPSAEQAHALGELQRAQDEIDLQVEALYDKEDDAEHQSDDAVQIEALEAQSEALQARINDIESSLACCAPEVAAMAGALLSLSPAGEPVLTRHLIRQEDHRKARDAAARAVGGPVDVHAGSRTGEHAEDSETAKGCGLSEMLRRQLTAHKTEALQVALVRKPGVALAALAHAMATPLLYNGAASRYESPTALGVSVQSCNWSLAQIEPTLANDLAHQQLAEMVQAWRSKVPAEPTGLLAYLLERPVGEVVELLTLCAALTASALHGSPQAKPAQALAAAVELDMADWWVVSGESYLGRVPKSLIAEALTEAGEFAAAATLAKLKKGEAVSRAEALLSGKRWLPAALRLQA